MGEDPRAIRAQIDETRARMGDTVEALSYKTDVRARARDAVAEKRHAVRRRVVGIRDAIVGTASDTTSAIGEALPDPEQVKGQARRAASVAQENPLGLAVGATALGFLAGMMAPSTRMEDERMGPLSDQVKETVTSTAEEAVEHGRQIVEEAGQAAAETARESAPEHARELQATAQRKVEDTAGGSQPPGQG